MESILTTEELAERHRITPNAVLQRRHRGQGPQGFRSGRRVLFRESAVTAWEKGQEDAETAKAS